MDISFSLVLIFKDLSSLRKDSIVVVRFLNEELISEPSKFPAVSIETSPSADLRSKRELEIIFFALMSACGIFTLVCFGSIGSF